MATMFQEVLASEPQGMLDMGQPIQNGIAFPATLAERYQPNRIDEFIGIERPKAFLKGLAAAPRACGLLFIGPPGSGKTALGMAFAAELPGSLIHVAAQQCDVAKLEDIQDRTAYLPPKGNFWVVLVDEADQMTDKAQLKSLSLLDGTAALKPVFGGGMVRGTPPPIIWIFTCNGIGPDETQAPLSLLPRFQSRTMKFEFEAATNSDLAVYLERIWNTEGGKAIDDAGYFPYMADGVGVRDALMRLESDLLAGPRKVPAPKAQEPEAPARKAAGNGQLLSPAKKAWITRRAKLAAAQKGKHR